MENYFHYQLVRFCFNSAAKNNMLGSNILDKATIPAWCFNRLGIFRVGEFHLKGHEPTRKRRLNGKFHLVKNKPTKQLPLLKRWVLAGRFHKRSNNTENIVAPDEISFSIMP